MIKRIFKTLTITESMFSLIGIINAYFGFTQFIEIDFIVRIILAVTGITILLYILYSFMLSNSVSNYITNNEKEYKKKSKSAFKNNSDKIDWMFLKLSDKYSMLSCKKLKKLINQHYEHIRDNK